MRGAYHHLYSVYFAEKNRPNLLRLVQTMIPEFRIVLNNSLNIFQISRYFKKFDTGVHKKNQNTSRISWRRIILLDFFSNLALKMRNLAISHEFM
jgi:hypothetical protein